MDAGGCAVYPELFRIGLTGAVMVLTGFRLILLICLFVSSALYVTSRQVSQRQPQQVVAAATTSLAASDETAAPDLHSKSPEEERAVEPQTEPTREPAHASSEPVTPAPSAPPSVAVTAAVEGVHQEPARKVEPVPVDPVRQAGADMPLDGNAGPAQDTTGLRKGLYGDDVVALAVDKQDGRPRNDVGRKVLRAGKQPRKAHDTRHRTRAAKAGVKRHHRALAKADKRKRFLAKAKIRKLAVQKRVKRRRRLANPAPALTRIAEGEFKPLPTAEWVTGTGIRSVW